MTVTNFYNYGTMNEVEAGATQINNYYGVEQQKAQESQAVTREEMAQAVVAVQSYMWGSSAYAVLFCELRDHKGYSNNMAQFERDITEIGEQYKLDWQCAEGTLSDAFRHNSFLEKHVDRWADIGAKSRAMLLLDKFQQALTQ